MTLNWIRDRRVGRARAERHHDRDAVADAGVQLVRELGADRDAPDVGRGPARRRRRAARSWRASPGPRRVPCTERAAQLVGALSSGRSPSGWRRRARSSPRPPRTGTAPCARRPACPRARRWMSSISLRSRRRRTAWTIRCAFSASTLSWNSRSKPLVTPNTTTSDATPSTTPIVETVVNTENTRSRNDTTATSPPARMPTTPAVSTMRCRCCGCASANTTKPTRHQRQPGHEADRRPARTPPAVQVAEADQPLQAQLEQLGQRPARARPRRRSRPASSDRPPERALAPRQRRRRPAMQDRSAPREGGRRRDSAHDVAAS